MYHKKDTNQTIVYAEDVQGLYNRYAVAADADKSGVVETYLKQQRRIQATIDRLEQIDRTKHTAVLGPIIRFLSGDRPVVYRGKELVSKDDIDNLIDKMKAAETDQQKRAIIRQYLYPA